MKKMTLFVNYCDPHSILVVNIEGALRRLFCPFRVLCIGSLHAIPKDSWVIVGEVSNSANVSSN